MLKFETAPEFSQLQGMARCTKIEVSSIDSFLFCERGMQHTPFTEEEGVAKF